MKIFGIGWAKTGTTTLGNCFNFLGYEHQSQDLKLVKYLENKKLDKIFKIAKNKDTFEDWPWIILYKELDEYFSNSRFILTVRDSDRWIKSYKNMLSNQGKANQDLNRIRQTL